MIFIFSEGVMRPIGGHITIYNYRFWHSRDWCLGNSANLSEVPNVTVGQMNLWMHYENIQGALKWHSAYQHLVTTHCLSSDLMHLPCLQRGFLSPRESMYTVQTDITSNTTVCSIWNHAFYKEFFPALKSLNTAPWSGSELKSLGFLGISYIIIQGLVQNVVISLGTSLFGTEECPCEIPFCTMFFKRTRKEYRINFYHN